MIRVFLFAYVNNYPYLALETKHNIMEEEKYTVWVGGVEVNDNLLTKDEAEALKDEYINDGYDDVVIDKYE